MGIGSNMAAFEGREIMGRNKCKSRAQSRTRFLQELLPWWTIQRKSSDQPLLVGCLSGWRLWARPVQQVPPSCAGVELFYLVPALCTLKL
jgi:hypothetical protein